MNKSLEIREINSSDAPELLAIYAHYVEHTAVSFETEVPHLDEFSHRLASISQSHPFLVGLWNGQIVGYAYASAWKSRQAYFQTVESSIYIRPDLRGDGLGSNLYRTLLKQIEEAGYHTVLAGISLPNPESVGFHEKLGFQRSGVLREVGYKFGKRIDVGYWQMTFN